MARLRTGSFRSVFLTDTDEFELSEEDVDEIEELLGVSLDADDLRTIRRALGTARLVFIERRRAPNTKEIEQQLAKIADHCQELLSATEFNASDMDQFPDEGKIDPFTATNLILRFGHPHYALLGTAEPTYIDELRKKLACLSDYCNSGISDIQNARKLGRGVDNEHIRALLDVVHPILVKHDLAVSYTSNDAKGGSPTSLWADLGQLLTKQLRPEERRFGRTALIEIVKELTKDRNRAAKLAEKNNRPEFFNYYPPIEGRD